MKQRALSLAFAFVFLALLIGTGSAENPDWPNGPGDDPALEPPDDPSFSSAWNLWSYIPDAVLPNVDPDEIPLGSGCHADRAWQVTTGDPSVVIAITDSGIYWDRDDVIEKVAINTGELPLPEDSASYDANNDGVVNIRDYDGDSRVYDANANSRIDAGDLIEIFSDGVDDDNNGYVDDIAGWDFFWDDNDPYDETRASHGSGEAEWSVGQGNNGIRNIGTCPDCMFIPLRVGDDFVGNSNHWAEAAVYATDNGASLIQHANGNLTWGPGVVDAINYAYEHDVLYVSAHGDETSFHHNYTGSLARSVYINCVRYDTNSLNTATSFLRLNNCSGWGSKTTLTGPSTSCSSGATGVVAGVAGLIYSRGVEIGLDPKLSAAEVKAILIESATDIDIPESLTDPDQYPSKPGWDQTFGYGRVHARDAVDMVTATTIPPEVEITSPRWFSSHDPLRTPNLVVEGYADARRATSYSWVLETAAGLEPMPSDYQQACQGQSLTTPTSGTLCSVNLTNSGVDIYALPEDPNQFTFTLRLTVTDNLGNRSEDRRVVYLVHDEDLLPAYPIDMEASGESSVVTADLNGDDVYEIIVADGGGQINVLDADGNNLPGWPVAVGPVPSLDPLNPDNHLGAPAFAGFHIAPWNQAIMAAPAVADLDDDGVVEIVVVTFEGQVYVYEANGSLKTGFPVSVDPDNATDDDPLARLEIGIVASPVLADMDLDEDLEIVVGAMDRYVYIWHHDGTPFDGFPVIVEDPTGSRAARIVASPGVGDVNGDGIPDIAVGTNERSQGVGRNYVIDGNPDNHTDSPYLPGWPVRIETDLYILPFVGEGTSSGPALYDLTNDGRKEVVISSGVYTPQAFDYTATLIRMFLTIPFGPRTNASEYLGAAAINFLVWADIDADNFPDMLTSGSTLGYLEGQENPGVRAKFDSVLYAMDGRTGLSFRYYPRKMEDWMFINGPSVAHLDDDPYPEIIAGSGGYILHAMDYQGQEPTGWPKFHGGWAGASPTVGDLDGDGLLEVICTNRDGFLYVWHTQGDASRPIESKGSRHDNRNTGCYETEIPTQPGPAATDDDDDVVDDDDDVTDDDDDATDDDDDVTDDDDDTTDDDVTDDDDDTAADDDDTSPAPAGDDDDDDECGC